MTKPTRKPSRQQRWQQRMRAEGRCVCCGTPTGGPLRCAEHREAHNAAMRARRGYEPWRPGGRGRPPIDATRKRRRRGGTD